MGTHPIFESDFDCLTEQSMDQIKINNEIEAQIAMMQQLQDQFKKMDESCKLKCIDGHYRSNLLSKNETVCINNCTSKYLEFNHQTQIYLGEMREHETLMMLEQQQMELGRQQGL